MNIQDFKTQDKIKETKEMKSIPYTDIKNIPDINNTNKHHWVQVGIDKYGRYMYCTKTNIKRRQTMGEFYGSGIVD